MNEMLKETKDLLEKVEILRRQTKAALARVNPDGTISQEYIDSQLNKLSAKLSNLS
jgi:hypothetical protein